MNHIKKFEAFSKDGIDVDQQSYPEYNQSINNSAKNYVDDIFKGGLNDRVNSICKEIGIDIPDSDDELDNVKRIALEYFSKNPERISNDIGIKKGSTKSNYIPKLNNIGGSFQN